jgi:hypothetical protein
LKGIVSETSGFLRYTCTPSLHLDNGSIPEVGWFALALLLSLGFRKLMGIASHVQWVPDERTYTLIAFRNLNGPEVEQFCTCSVTQSWILKLCCGARWSRARAAWREKKTLASQKGVKHPSLATKSCLTFTNVDSNACCLGATRIIAQTIVWY